MHFLDMESFSTKGFRLFEGRPFEPETKKTDELSSILVNRKFVEELGIIEPVGKMVLMNDTLPLIIIGVLENLLDEGAWTTKISPVFYRLADSSYKTKALNLRIAPENRDGVIKHLEDEWAKLVPDSPFMGMEGDVFIEASQYVNNKIISIAVFLVLIALILSVAGLYSQASLRLVHRTKEIGIRKIFGATIPGVIKILNYEFLVILGPGVLVGLIVGYYANIALMDSIWEYFNYPRALSFIIPVLLIFAVSSLIVSAKVYYTASRNPVHALRYE